MTNQLTKTETKYLKMFDRRDIRIRIPFKEKRPHITNWTKYYSETSTIQKLLEKGFNYGIRTGKKIGDYFNVVIDLDDLWAKERIKDTRYIQTNKGVHRYLLIKELPKSCWLVNKLGEKIGEIHSLGRQVVGIGSIHESGVKYTLKGGVKQPWSLKFEKLIELQEFLTQRKIFTTPWGKKGLENIRDLELYEKKEPKPKPISKEFKYFQKKEKLEAKVNKSPKKELLNICYICLVYFPKQAELIKSHLSGNKHQKNWKIYQAKKSPNSHHKITIK